MQDPVPGTPLPGEVKDETSDTSQPPITSQLPPNGVSAHIVTEGADDISVTAVAPNDVPPFDIRKPIPILTSLFPDRYAEGHRGGGMPTTIGNLRFMLDYYRIHVRFDVFAKRIVITIMGQESASEIADNAALAHVRSLMNQNMMSVGMAPDFISAIASENPINAPLNWITSKDWDGVDRIQPLADVLVTPDDFPPSLKLCLLTRWLCSAAAAALGLPQFKARGVIVLQGPQGCGKTTFIIKLVSDPAICAKYVKTGHQLDPDNKDSVISAISHWLVELGELETTLKKDIARLKGFLTESIDRVRLPYDKLDSHFPRRTVFAASVNGDTFLVDTTGNSRFWTIPVIRIDNDHDIDTQQVFAQALQLIRDGEQWWLTPEEEALLAESNKKHQAINAIRDQIIEAMDDTLPTAQWTRLSCIELLSRLGFERPTNQQCKDAAATLRELEPTIGPKTRSQGKDRWNVPLRKFGVGDDAY